MGSHLRVLSAVFTALVPVTLSAPPALAAPPTAIAVPAPGAVKIDAALDEPGWAQAEWSSDFRSASDKAGNAGEPKPMALVAQATEHDGNVWGDDGIEVFFDPANEGRYHHHFVVDTKGVWHDGGSADYGLGHGKLWDCALVMAASVRTRASAIVALIEALRARDPRLLSVVLAWELENEVCLSAKTAPLNQREGEFTFAGRRYNLGSDHEAQALMDDVLAQWANLCADAIHEADPEALVSAGVFSFAAVGRGGPGTLSTDTTGDERVPARPLALLRSRLDYVDVHLYAWRTAEQSVSQHLDRDLDSVEWDEVQAKARELGKPLMCGECGVFANYLRAAPNWQEINHELGAQCFREQVAGLKERGLAGALYWSYGNPDSTAGDENPSLTFHPQYGRILRETWATQP